MAFRPIRAERWCLCHQLVSCIYVNSLIISSNLSCIYYLKLNQLLNILYTTVFLNYPFRLPNVNGTLFCPLLVTDAWTVKLPSQKKDVLPVQINVSLLLFLSYFFLFGYFVLVLFCMILFGNFCSWLHSVNVFTAQ